jgi:hypothetical protein
MKDKYYLMIAASLLISFWIILYIITSGEDPEINQCNNSELFNFNILNEYEEYQCVNNNSINRIKLNETMFNTQFKRVYNCNSIYRCIE